MSHRSAERLYRCVNAAGDIVLVVEYAHYDRYKMCGDEQWRYYISMRSLETSDRVDVCRGPSSQFGDIVVGDELLIWSGKTLKFEPFSVTSFVQLYSHDPANLQEY